MRAATNPDDKVICHISESARGLHRNDDTVEILDWKNRSKEKREYSGIMRHNGVEHFFRMRETASKDRELLTWQPQPGFVRETLEVRELSPDPLKARAAIGTAATGGALWFLQAWKADFDARTERGREIVNLGRAFSAATLMQGGLEEMFYLHRKAAAYGYTVGKADEVLALKRKLVRAALRVRPIARDWEVMDAQEIRLRLREWDGIFGETSQDTTGVGQILDEIADHLAPALSTIPDRVGIIRIQDLGYDIAGWELAARERRKARAVLDALEAPVRPGHLACDAYAAAFTVLLYYSPAANSAPIPGTP